MRQRFRTAIPIFLAALISLLAARRAEAQGKADLAGKWLCDIEATLKIGGDSAKFAKLLKQQGGKVEMEFKSDGGYRLTIDVLNFKNTSRGTWKHLKTDGKKVMIEVQTEDNDKKFKGNQTIEFLSKDRIRSQPEENSPSQIKEMFFDRAKN